MFGHCLMTVGASVFFSGTVISSFGSSTLSTVQVHSFFSLLLSLSSDNSISFSNSSLDIGLYLGVDSGVPFQGLIGLDVVDRFLTIT